MQNSIEEQFFELLRLSIGTQQEPTKELPEADWEALFLLAVKQSIAGVLLTGLDSVLAQSNIQKPKVLLEWIGLQLQIDSQNKLQHRRAKELSDIFKDGGFRSCVLKGQGTATYYDHPELRQCGDIDLWVEGDRGEIVKYVQSKGVHVESVDIKDSATYFFNDVMVEVHYRPNCMFNPWTDRKLQAFFNRQADGQFSEFDDKLGFAHTTIEFDLVYSLVHIYRHIFSEGIGLRQLVDYFYILKHSNAKQRDDAYKTISGFGMKNFAGGIMYILQKKFGMDLEYTLCDVNKRHGEYLLNEIMIGGNFGQYDTRYSFAGKDKKFKRGINMLERNMHYVALYPSEVLWSPIWKLWHWCWRKRKGYL